MRNPPLTSKTSIILVANMLSSVASFSFFPYISTNIASFLSLTSAQASSIVGIGVLGGSVLAYLSSTLMQVDYLKRKTASAFMIGLFSIMALFAIRYFALIPFYFFALTLILFRFSVSYSSNLIKALQLQGVQRDDQRVSLLGYIKVATSIGGAIGPIFGGYLINNFSVSVLLAASSFLLFLSAISILFVDEKKEFNSSQTPSKYLNLVKIPRNVFYLCLIGFVHFVFEAQIYSYMAVSIDRANPDKFFLPIMFSGNAVFLILLTIPTLRFITKLKIEQSKAIMAGSFFSLIGIIATPYLHSSFTVLIITLIYTLGEIITPQIILQQISKSDNAKDSLKYISTYNLMTFGFGLTVGYLLSSLLISQQKHIFPIVVFIVIYCVFVSLVIFSNNKNNVNPNNNLN